SDPAGAYGLTYFGMAQGAQRKLALWVVAFGRQTVVNGMGGDCDSEHSSDTSLMLPLQLLFDGGTPRLINMNENYDILADRFEQTVPQPFNSDAGTAQATL